MTPLAENVLRILESSADHPVSGENIARTLGCSRAAVWKAVNALRERGYDISAKNRSGYTLVSSPDVLSARSIMSRLQKAGLDMPVICFDTVDSTNSEAKRIAQTDARELCVIASEQSAGRGRLGRAFFSPSGTGLYMTLLLHPAESALYAMLLTPLAAAAVAGALEDVCGRPAGIKWVNDIFMDGKKVCGILCEASIGVEDRKLDTCIVGIGINLFEPEGGFPEEIKDTAGAVFSDGASRPDLRNELAARIIVRFMDHYRDLPEKTYMDDYRRRSFVLGKDIMVLRAMPVSLTQAGMKPGPSLEKRPARALDLDEMCRLLVEYPDGSRELLSSGEISIRPADAAN